MAASTTPFPLGAYLGNPNNSSATEQATYDAAFASFVRLMGSSPQFITTYVDYRQTVGQWVSNAAWAASSVAQSVNARSMVPVIGLPLASIAASAGAPDQQFQAFASGQNDSVIKGIVGAWAQQGFHNLIFRPGWEMNLEGPTYAGGDAQSQADWVRAFQHVTTVLRQAAAADGVTVQIVWNPGATNYSNAPATTSLYPGDAYVDIIGADIYGDIHPYSDGGATPTYHDWHTGAEDTSVAQFIADPVNRAHYWSLPAATKWSDDGSNGHSQSLASLIQFAHDHGKAFAIPEAGAGNSTAGADVTDDAAFPQWLAQQLSAARASGTAVSFVNLWDSNGGGNYAFSAPANGKPAEAAAWAAYFGAAPNPAPGPVTLGTGADTLALVVSEDAWQGDAQFTLSVDGAQIGGVQTATASHGAGQSQTYNVLGTFGPGTHQVAVNFLNDAYGGTAATDRNLYVGSATIDGTAVPGAALTLLSGGVQRFAFAGPAAHDTLDLHVSEDAWQGDAQYTIAIDGVTIGGVRTAAASHAAGATQDVSLAGSWGAGPHTAAVTFLNDAYGGSPSTDRNLYVDALSYDGTAASGAPAALMSGGTRNFGIAGPSVPTVLTVHLSEDAWNGDAQYAIAIDGGAAQTGPVTVLHASGLSQAVTVSATLSVGAHDVAVSFLNDAYGGSSSTDRNLYLKGIDVNGSPAPGTAASFYSGGTSHFGIVVPAT